jgi:hypothetical protein
MEKILIFGLSAWLCLMLSEASPTMKRDQQYVPVSGINDSRQVTPGQPKVVFKSDPANKPVRAHYHAILLRDPR